MTENLYQVSGDLEDIDDAAELGRLVKCNLEELMESHPNKIITVDIEIGKVANQERCPHQGDASDL